MKGVILQPSYIPWRGYFHLIQMADVFVFFDDVQYTKRDWRNRNIVKGPQGTRWLTVPVITKGRRDQLIRDVQIDNGGSRWREKHLSTLRHCYSKAVYFEKHSAFLEEIYSREWDNLCELDIALTLGIASVLDIETRFVRSSELQTSGAKTEKLLNICKLLGIRTYISGPRGRDYILPELFARNGIEVTYHSYDYAEYPQLFGEFVPDLTILDLLFNCGDESCKYIWDKHEAWKS